MKLLGKFLLTVFLAIGFTDCQKDSLLSASGLQLKLYEGQESSFEDGRKSISVKFASIEELSLCPPDVVCIWQGRLVVELLIDSKDTLYLGLGELQGTEFVQSQVYDDYIISLEDYNWEKEHEAGSIVLKIQKN